MIGYQIGDLNHLRSTNNKKRVDQKVIMNLNEVKRAAAKRTAEKNVPPWKLKVDYTYVSGPALPDDLPRSGGFTRRIPKPLTFFDSAREYLSQVPERIELDGGHVYFVDGILSKGSNIEILYKYAGQESDELPPCETCPEPP